MTWLPTEYQDEATPPPRETPDAWITKLDDGAPALAACNEDGAPDNGYSRPWRLTDGQVVAFQEYTDFGEAMLTVAEDGAWTVDRPQPVGANCVRIDYDYVGENLEDAVKTGWGMGEALPAGIYNVDYYAWTDDVAFRFDAASRCFVRIEQNG
jgi:hypothetical protein